MLWMALTMALASAPDMTTSPITPGRLAEAMAPVSEPRSPTVRRITLPNGPTCEGLVRRIDGPVYRDPQPTVEGRVRMYRLFDLRHANGCPIPVIARDVPEADRFRERNLSGH